MVNNVVDGKSLAIDESYAFECNSGRSLWANNIVYDVPQQAFVVRSGFENTFMNNLIVNARVGQRSSMQSAQAQASDRMT